MKLVKILSVLAASALFITSCDDKPIAPEQLPEAVRTYVQTNYPGSRILIAKKDYEWFKTTYDVQLDNGLELSFNSNGVLTDIDD